MPESPSHPEHTNAPPRPSIHRQGDHLLHKAAYNRYQEYHVKTIEWDTNAQRYVYTVDFREWKDSSRYQLETERIDWRLAETLIPIPEKLISWGKNP